MFPQAIGLLGDLKTPKWQISNHPLPHTPPHPQAIGLLDDLDKELNTYAMRVREWYGWHFPEMTKIVGDNIQYAKAVRITCCSQNSTHQYVSM